MNTVHIDLGARSYPIHIGDNLLAKASLVADFGHQQICIVSNTTIAPLYIDAARSLFADRQIIEVRLDDGERFKNTDALNKIYDSLIEAAFDRSCLLVALGGGVVGDITGYAAASYQRGVEFLQIPTTLLAQVDSSVGGKTGVNHPRGKNMIGAFHQPVAVLADINTLRTLADREFASGMAEVIKYGAIMDLEFLHWLDNHAEKILARDPAALAQMIAHSCQCKATIVAQDERENGRRALLNFGHTYGHALEAITNYQHWLHGETVAIGMSIASELSLRLGNITSAEHELLLRVMKKFNLPVRAERNFAAEDIRQLMLRDKKTRSGQIRLVILNALGAAELSDSYDSAVFDSHLRQVFSA